jgi:hypothetical protein
MDLSWIEIDEVTNRYWTHCLLPGDTANVMSPAAQRVSDGASSGVPRGNLPRTVLTALPPVAWARHMSSPPSFSRRDTHCFGTEVSAA